MTFPRVASFRRQPWAGKSTTPMVLVHVHRFPNKQTKPSARNHPNETVGAVPVCPPVSPCKGASVVHPPHTMRVFLVWKRRCADVRAGTQAPPLPISTKPRGVPLPIVHSIATPPYCTFDSFKPRGVPLPHRGYTFDSAGLASATRLPGVTM